MNSHIKGKPIQEFHFFVFISVLYGDFSPRGRKNRSIYNSFDGDGLGGEFSLIMVYNRNEVSVVSYKRRGLPRELLEMI